jgi:hypothetical protein
MPDNGEFTAQDSGTSLLYSFVQELSAKTHIMKQIEQENNILEKIITQSRKNVQPI